MFENSNWQEADQFTINKVQQRSRTRGNRKKMQRVAGLETLNPGPLGQTPALWNNESSP